MASFLDHLRRHVLSTATEAVGDLPGFESKLGQSEISNFDMAIMINQEILRFEISVDDILLMQVHQAIENLDKIEFSVVL